MLRMQSAKNVKIAKNERMKGIWRIRRRRKKQRMSTMQGTLKFQRLRRKTSRCCEFTEGEDVQCFFSNKPALKLGQQITGTAADTTSPVFPVERH